MIGTLLSLALAALAAASSDTGAVPHRPRHVVVVDAGHGGVDSGMRGSVNTATALVEKDVTLQVARLLSGALAARGIDVVMTRTTDTLIALADRGRVANESHGELFISIHVNAANPSRADAAAWRGFETYFLAEAKTEDAARVARVENDAARFESAAAKADTGLSFVLDDMARNEHLRESSDLATTIQRSLASALPAPSRGVKQARFKVLVTAFMPAVLVEIGYGSNKREAAFLTDPAGQQRIAAAIAAATSEYLSRYERRLATAGQ